MLIFFFLSQVVYIYFLRYLDYDNFLTIIIRLRRFRLAELSLLTVSSVFVCVCSQFKSCINVASLWLLWKETVPTNEQKTISTAFNKPQKKEKEAANKNKAWV